MMKFIIVCLAYIAIVSADTAKWKDFRVKFSPVDTGIDVDSFWRIPPTLVEAFTEGWVQVSTPNPLTVLTMCRTGKDFRMCPLYDSNGFIAGVQVAIPPSDVEDHGIPYDFNRFPVYEKKPINGVMYWTSIFYLVHPDIIIAGGRENPTVLGDGMWLKNGTSYTEIPTDEQTINYTSSYTWQNCIPSMGKHYYNNMTPMLSCEDFQPFFILAKDGDMIGIGWQFFGRTQYVDYDWYDRINGQAVKATVPLGPDCLHEGADEYGVISIHFFFVEEPWKIACNQETDSVVPLPIP